VVPLDMRPSLLAKCARERQAVISNDVLADPDYLSSDLLPHTRSEAALPLMHGDRLIGVLDVQAKEPERFTVVEVRALQTLSAHVSIAIENARLYEAERTARARADALRDASRVLSSTLSLEEVLQSILNQCAMIVPFTSSAVMIYQNDTPTVAAMAGSLKFYSLPPRPELAQLLYDGPILTRIRETREAIIVADVLKDPNWIPFPDPTIGGCWMGVPLIARDRMTGILMLLNEQPHAYSAEHLEFVQGLAGHAALAIENAQLYEALERQASHLEDLVQERTAEVVRQREQLRAIVESAGEAIIFTDPLGIVEYANPAWERLSGHSPEYVRGQRAVLLFGGNEAMYAEVKAAVLEGRGWSGDVHTRRTDGSEYDVAVTVAPVLDADGALVNVVGVFRDITTQKEVERMRRNFLTSISHELRTPITNMKLFHRLLQTGAEERRQDYLDTLSGEVDRLERLIEDLLDISRIDQGLPAMNPEPLDLNEIVREVQRAHAFRAEERGLSLDLDLYDSMPPITGDRQRFMQVLVNLIANAINYTNRGGRIGVRTALRSEEGGLVAVVSVWDTGIGIAPQDLPFVFNRFFRAANAKVEGVPGTGLGLSIVQEIVEMHGGRITVESTPGSGTTFTVTLPIHQMGEESESEWSLPV
jgi:PAS domain S-box-containing protein